jgi:hypothetical protein
MGGAAVTTMTLTLPATLAARLTLYARLLDTTVEELALTALRALVHHAKGDEQGREA